ncbi:DUF2163 domain-containing protein [Prosthecomicrobium pneumaticum]|uniref:Putative phage protein (TIGR02218 family) n=1 Tax=Prosthecomicrobium pneumaticum TaxID=81895 RepID=A0A7W9FR83_9HYPH|nr:DUF2163 domain-containing protein [Prosthecomicrobium pneumaticum]MBB5755281.1 putative phage protein (TIGR02218 family) [Prosthecomicrobium pneumaticum]
MRIIGPELAAHLAGGVTALARVWVVRRRDGVVLGFTDHDRDIVFDGVVCAAASGFSAGEAAAESGFAAGGMEVEGALASESLSEADLAAGLYDDAAVEVWLVDWRDPAVRHRLRSGHIGETVREDGAFRAEIRGLAARLDQPSGRAFRAACDADLGDPRCGVDLALAAYRVAATVGAGDGGRRIEVALGDFPAGWFERGRLVFTSGANQGFAATVRLQQGGIVELWQTPPRPVSAGDGFTLTAGCDKRFSTCREKFANSLNFRGFPHMPGNDFAFGYARADANNDGGIIVP